MKDTMQAYVLEDSPDEVSGAVKAFETARLPEGEVTIRVAASGINYKDAMIAYGVGRMVRNFPHIPGVDLAGTVEADASGRFREGDAVLVTGYDLGVGHFGGYAEYAQVPADWAVPLPEGLDAYEAMTLGTAGFTAMLGLMALERNEVRPDSGPVLVTGASGGVGSIAVEVLAKAGYTVVASSGKADMADALRRLGASEVVGREEVLDESPRPLLKERWAAVMENVGGATLASVLRTVQRDGAVALAGNVGGNAFSTTVLPFILRGINLLGVDSVACPMPRRLEAWRRLAGPLKPAHLGDIAHPIALADLPARLKEILDGGARGRYVVRIGE